MALKLLETNITLDLYDHDGTRPSIKSIALDDNTRYVFAKLTYKQELYDIGSTATVKLIIIRPDKVGAQIAGEAKEIQIGQEDESIITIYGAYAELDQPAIAVAGTLLGQFIITSGNQILRSQIFAVNNGEALDADEWAEYDGYNLDELAEKVDGMTTATAEDVGKFLKAKTVTDGNVTEWEFGEAADPAVIEGAVSDWLDAHPESTTTVEDGAITEAKLNSEVTGKLLSDYYYPEITSWQERLYDTTCYFVSVPVRDTDNNVINPYLKYEADLTPLDHAIANHTTFTCNGTTACLQNGSIVRGHVISRGRSVYNNTLTSVANTFRYVSINADRTVTDYAVNDTTQADMLGNGAYNVFCAYYKLIDNGTIVDNSATVNNENKNVSTLYVPYAAIGVKSDNTLLFMATDGGTDIDKGLNSVNAANILLEKGCVNAWAMDGGGSVSFNVRGAKYNRNIDNDGTTDRLVHITLNFKKDSKSDSVTEAFGKIGEEKQNVVKQVMPYINDLYDKHDSLINNEAIASGTDLNTITAIGRYAATTSAVAGSLTNSPTTVAFMMEIIKISSTMSFYVILDYNADIYVRRNYVYSNANHFSAWKKVTTT